MVLTQEQLDACWEELNRFAPESISWNHYDLATNTDINDVALWKAFIQRGDVAEWLEEERILLQRAELSKLSTRVADSRSTGQAQLIAAMGRLNESNKIEAATGPAFIYTYIPLNKEQEHAANVKILDEDIFYVKPTDFNFCADSAPPPLPES